MGDLTNWSAMYYFNI